MKVALISASLDGFDQPLSHEVQSIFYDSYFYNDENFPPRPQTMKPRMLAKIPKCFGWQLAPGYDYYVWLDGNYRLRHPEALKFFVESCQDYDFVATRHPKRPNIRQEARTTRKGVRQQAFYRQRYLGEREAELYSLIGNDKEYVDDTLVSCGMFIYRNTPEVQAALKEWWYYISRYHVNDQLSFPYVIRKAGLRLNVLEDGIHDAWFAAGAPHNRRS